MMNHCQSEDKDYGAISTRSVFFQLNPAKLQNGEEKEIAVSLKSNSNDNNLLVNSEWIHTQQRPARYTKRCAYDV